MRGPRSVTRKPALSPTKISTFLECAVKYRYVYIDKIGRFYLRSRAGYSFGSTLHHVLQQFHEQGAAHSVEEMTAAFWDRVMAINVRGTFLSVRAAVRPLRSAGQGGSIVIYTSTAGQRGSAVYSAYATSKAAQIVFMRSMALELAPDRIRVNCIAPAWTETDMVTASIEEIGRAKIIRGFPLGRIGLPDDIAGATCFLLSDLASFITATTLTVDGGMDMRG